MRSYEEMRSSSRGRYILSANGSRIRKDGDFRTILAFQNGEPSVVGVNGISLSIVAEALAKGVAAVGGNEKAKAFIDKALKLLQKDDADADKRIAKAQEEQE